MGLRSYEEGYFHKGNAKFEEKGFKRQAYSIRIRKELQGFAKENRNAKETG